MSEQSNYRLVGINIVVMVVYSILCRVSNGNESIILLAMLIALHIVVCLFTGLVSAFTQRYRFVSGMWLLSSLAVLLLGFSTCMAVYTIKI